MMDDYKDWGAPLRNPLPPEGVRGFDDCSKCGTPLLFKVAEEIDRVCIQCGGRVPRGCVFIDPCAKPGGNGSPEKPFNTLSEAFGDGKQVT